MEPSSGEFDSRMPPYGDGDQWQRNCQYQCVRVLSVVGRCMNLSRRFPIGYFTSSFVLLALAGRICI